jgi:hypothetical protein
VRWRADGKTQGRNADQACPSRWSAGPATDVTLRAVDGCPRARTPLLSYLFSFRVRPGRCPTGPTLPSSRPLIGAGRPGAADHQRRQSGNAKGGLGWSGIPRSGVSRPLCGRSLTPPCAFSGRTIVLNSGLVLPKRWRRTRARPSLLLRRGDALAARVGDTFGVPPG